MTRPIASPATLIPNVPGQRVRGFRTRILVAMMLLVFGVTVFAVVTADRKLVATMQRDLERTFATELAAVQNAEAIRHAALVERCRALVRRPRIHAALEDNAIDLLYLSAEDELRDLRASDDESAAAPGTLRARFYRFLDRTGQVIRPVGNETAGTLSRKLEAELALPGLSEAQQVGLVPTPDFASGVTEIISTPIISTETGEPIAALVLGFRPLAIVPEGQMRTGLWVDGRLHMLAPAEPLDAAVTAELRDHLGKVDNGSFEVPVHGIPHLLFFHRSNPHSAYAPAYEVSLFSVAPFAARRSQLRFQIVSVGSLLLIGAFLVSRVVSARLSAPVEQLAAESERSARFSADASHQLKTPVTVLRAGLEELLARENLTTDECDAIAALIHQTFRLSSLIDDLLLLSRMDSGRLQLKLASVDLAHLIAGALDDLSAIPEETTLEILTDVPPTLAIRGEPRYTAIILQNLLENARKYNRPNGRIRVAARRSGELVLLTIGNTGAPIAPQAQPRIFERFHRGAMGENIPGYGLGLNLARELARLHEGDLRLVTSAGDWTEFEVRLRAAKPADS